MEEAARMNDDYKVYSTMLDIYASSGKKQVREFFEEHSNIVPVGSVDNTSMFVLFRSWRN